MDGLAADVECGDAGRRQDHMRPLGPIAPEPQERRFAGSGPAGDEEVSAPGLELVQGRPKLVINFNLGRGDRAFPPIGGLGRSPRPAVPRRFSVFRFRFSFGHKFKSSYPLAARGSNRPSYAPCTEAKFKLLLHRPSKLTVPRPGSGSREPANDDWLHRQPRTPDEALVSLPRRGIQNDA